MNRRIGEVLAGSVSRLPAITLVVAFGWAAAASNGATMPRPAVPASASVLNQLRVGRYPAGHRLPGPAIDGLTQLTDENWSGYADDNSRGNTYRRVTAQWKEPKVSCTAQTSLAVFWVGIDGLYSHSVEQDGTLAYCYKGTAYYYTWWEMYPSNNLQAVGDTVSPGDSITASVVRTGTTYSLQVTDSTHPADGFTKTERCTGCDNSSAEWIAEAPTSSSGIEPLADFHTWTLTQGAVESGSVSGSISSFPDDEITMIDSTGHVQAKPGALSPGGSSFTVTWKRSN